MNYSINLILDLFCLGCNLTMVSLLIFFFSFFFFRPGDLSIVKSGT